MNNFIRELDTMIKITHRLEIDLIWSLSFYVYIFAHSLISRKIRKFSKTKNTNPFCIQNAWKILWMKKKTLVSFSIKNHIFPFTLFTSKDLVNNPTKWQWKNHKMLNLWSSSTTVHLVLFSYLVFTMPYYTLNSRLFQQ